MSKARTLKISTKAGAVEVPVYVRSKGLAVTALLRWDETIDTSCFKITHERSGMSISWIAFGSIHDARRALRRVVGVTDWSRTAKALCRQRTLGARVEAVLVSEASP